MILQLASSLARMENSDLHVVQVWSVVFEGYMEVRGNLSDQAVRRLRKDTKRQYMRRVDQLMASIDLADIGVVRLHLRRGDDPAAASALFGLVPPITDTTTSAIPFS